MLLKRLQSLLNGNTQKAQRPGRKGNAKAAKKRQQGFRPTLVALEDRVMPSTMLYLDFGDRFPNNQLISTVGALVNTTSGNNPNVAGPQLADRNNNPKGGGGTPYPASTSLTMTAFNSFYGANAAAMRATIDSLVQRFYRPLDVTVVDLTANFQTVGGVTVRGASSMNEISQTLGLNEGQAKNNDGYMLIAGIAIGPNSDDPTTFATNGYGGIAGGADIGGTNNNDGTALTLLNSSYPAAFLGDQVAHESGHLFGLRHTFGNSPATPPAGSGINAGLLGSDLMSYLGYNKADPAGLDFFSRYPMVAGDGNVNNDVLSASPTPFDQLLNDPNVGSSGITYVTGTGQNDLISISRVGNKGRVTVDAFSDTNYKTPIAVPGTFGTSTTYSYQINLDGPIYIDAGAGNDRVFLAADLGPIEINVRGMAGTDELIVFGTAAADSFTVGGDSVYVPVGPGLFSLRYSEMEKLTVDTKAGDDTVSVTDTSVNTVIASSGGRDTVKVGAAGSARFIRAPLTIQNPASLTALDIDSSADTVSRFVSVGGTDITGLAPATISYPQGNLSSLTVHAGSGGNEINIINTPSAATTLYTGSGNDHVIVVGTSGPLSVSGQGGHDSVEIGFNGTVRAIAKALAVSNQGGSSDVVVDDSKDDVARTAIVYTALTLNVPNTVISGLTPGGDISMRYSQVSSLQIRTGSGGNTFRVHDTPFGLVAGGAPTTIETGLGNDLVTVDGASGPLTVNGQAGRDTVNIGAGSVRSIGSSLNVTNALGFSAVNVDDSADTGARTVIIYNNGVANGSFTVIDGLTPGGDIVLRGATLSSLTIRTGMSTFNGSGNTFRIHDTPVSATPGGLTTSIFTGPGPDQVTIDGTTGALAVDVQGAQQGGNTVIVGSPSTGISGISGINGPISVTGRASVANRLTIDDAASTIGHDYFMGRDFVQRSDKAQINFQNMQDFGLTAGSQTDHIMVQDTMPQIRTGIGSTTIAASGGDDLIDVSKTTGFLVMSATGHSVVNVGDDLNSLDNIQGAIAVGPSGGSAVTLNLNDQAATTPQRLDISASILGTSFQRSGAANIQVIGNPLDTFNWTSGSGGTTINMYVRPPAQTVNFNLGNDVLNIGSKTHTISDFGALTVTGGIGPDGLVLNDSGETRPQTYTVSQADGRETIATRGTTIDLGPDLEQVTLKGGSGGNTFNVEGTVAGLTTILFAGTGSDAVAVGDTDNRLQGIQGPVTLNGQGGVDQLTFNDQGTDTVENYTLAADLLRRVEATGFFEDMAPISFASFKAITLNMSGAASAASTAAVVGSVANTTVTVNGSAGSPNDFAVDASANAIKGPVVFNGQPADGDFAQYYDIGNTAPHTYTLTSTGVKRDGQAQVFSNVGAIVYASMVGGNTVNVSSVALGGSFKIQAASGDQVTVGSKAPRLGGTLTNILDQVNVVSYTANDAVTVVFDDSGNVDTTAKHVTFSGFDADGNVSMLGLTSIAQSWNLPATSSVKVLGGAADEIFSLRSAVTATPLFINGGGGVNTLDYSGYDVTASIPGLISWYKGEGDATDAVSANNGTPTNGATFAQGQVGQAFSLDGVDDFIEIPDSPNQTPSSLTLEAWVNPVSVIGLRSILSKYQSSDPGPDNVSWFLGSIDGRIQFGVYQSGLGRVIETDNPVLVEGSWQHVAGTFDVATQTIKIYLNGVEIPSSFVAGHDHTVTGIGDSNSPVRIGTLSNSDGVLNGFWSGLVDEASIYDRALSDSDIQSIVAAGSAGKSAQPATDVTVNLQLGTATGIAGGIANIQNVIGGNGNDTLIAGAGRSILIGGGGADNLIGGSGQAILISGTTDFTQPALDIAALDVVFQEWNRTDLGFEDRMSDLLTGSNSQGVAAKNVVAGMEILLNSNTVHDDLFADSLAGGTGRDWFFNGPGDVISNIKAGDVVT